MTSATHPDPCRVVCAGDWLTSHRIGATEALERLCRIDEPELPWRFWHLGDPMTSAADFLQEAVWKAVGLGAGRLVLSLGGFESQSESFDPSATGEAIRKCMRLLSDKGPRHLHLILPCPALWTTERRDAIQALRESLTDPVDRWQLVDLQPRAAGFLDAQARHPDLAAALVEDTDGGPALTGLGALLAADELRKALRNP